jgi:hypothetical protein
VPFFPAQPLEHDRRFIRIAPDRDEPEPHGVEAQRPQGIKHGITQIGSAHTPERFAAVDHLVGRLPFPLHARRLRVRFPPSAPADTPDYRLLDHAPPDPATPRTV